MKHAVLTRTRSAQITRRLAFVQPSTSSLKMWGEKRENAECAPKILEKNKSTSEQKNKTMNNKKNPKIYDVLL